VRWLKVPEAAKEWAGDVSAKTMYAAIRDGKLMAASRDCNDESIEAGKLLVN
jgi:hypothetical protein